ncbi:hypothetical protein L208DRAFT_1396292, partial [Tricholoma matsutake]
KNNICHLNTKDLVVIVFFIIPSSLHHRCSVIHPDCKGSQQWCGGVMVVHLFGPRCPIVVQYLKKFIPIVVPAPVVPHPSSLIVAC